MLWSLSVAVIVVTATWGTAQGQCNSMPSPCPLGCRCSASISCQGSWVSSGCGSQGCKPGWSGSTCQRQNVVYGTTNPRGNTNLWSSSIAGTSFYRIYAFDGLSSRGFRSHIDNNPYLWVKLPSSIYVYSMRMFISGTNTNVQTFQIHVSDSYTFINPSLCYQGTITSTLTEYNITCTRQLLGQYVRIQVLAVTALIVQEWEIYKCANYWFGEGCSRLCNCRDPTQTCNEFSGRCGSGCPDGYTGTDCYTACPAGRFGEGCRGGCHCKIQAWCGTADGTCGGQGCADGYTGNTCQQACPADRFGEGCRGGCHCKIQAWCGTAGGTCGGQGCVAGYTGNTCQQACPARRFGEGCRGGCHCKIQAWCGTADGTCGGQGCAAGYTGNTCQHACPVGQFGEGCHGACHCKNQFSCSIVHGTCDAQGCAPGYTGGDCQQVCTNYRFGTGCLGECHCKNQASCNKVNGTCDGQGCAAGYMEYDCQQVCPVGKFGERCQSACRCIKGTCNHVDGICDTEGCAAGFTGDSCQNACPDGRFGVGCLGECHCKNQASCIKADGTCGGQGCSAGHKGDNCQQNCPAGKFGEGCDGDCRCKNVMSCDKVNGTCDEKGCTAGYKGGNCQTQCDDNSYGEMCNQTCGHCMNNDACNSVDGSCPGGCLPNYEGGTCQQLVAGPATDDSTSAVIGGVCAGVVALVIVIVAILLYRKRFRPTSSGKQKEEEIDFSDDAVNLRPVVPAAPEVQEAANHSLYANTGEIGLSTTVVRAQDFVAYVTKKLSEDKVLENEFEKLPSGLLENVTEAYKENNVKKCRYRGLLPYDQTRVVMGVLDGDPSTDFINASYVHGYMKQKAFIASQGTTTVNIDDFWRMIWEKEVGKIVMLTHLFENGKEKVKQYWPDEGVAEFGDISVETIDSQHFVDHSVRTLKVQQGTNVRIVTQFHYLDWKDHSAPRDTSGIIELREKINQTSSKLNGPVLVHCSAGVGRTGTYIAFDYLIRKLEAEPEVDIFQTVVELRHQRTQIVQTKEQYVFLYKVLRDAFLCRGSTITSDALMQKKLDSPSFRSKIQEEFQKLEQLKVPMDKSVFQGALAGENRKKNRDPRCIPNDMDRVWLSTNVPGRNSYVNAMFVPAEGGNNRMIATQMPFGDTRIDFWRLVYEQKSTLVVLLNSLTKTDDRYWPGDNTPMEIGPFRISLVEETDGDALVIRKLSVVYNRMKKSPPHDVHLYCFTGWPEGQGVPASPVDIVSLKAQVFAWQRRANAGPVIVQCRNGTDRSALYCVCDFLLDRLKSERSVNVLLTAKRFQTYFINSIKSEAEYGFCYLVAEAYLNNFNVYANFSSAI